MSLPDILLDDLTFQNDIIDEVVRRVPRYCPEWTELNMSDPGRMLIEAFAWMTTMQTYRLNQVPDKHHRKLLELIGVELQPAHPARVELTFWLAAPFPLNPDDKDDPAFAIIERGTEVATVPLGNATEEIILRLRIIWSSPNLSWFSYVATWCAIKTNWIIRIVAITFTPN